MLVILYEFRIAFIYDLQHFGYTLDLLVVGLCLSSELQGGSKGEDV
jgi:hypothetical protein